ncbi:hypothetical protein ACIQU4_27820 [Streptomyces sp. NPDC090741]|uniref:hypothetical protein n=1 Tax=Streptomyces sp. NPDC090741 TaxID=3365967 RepID=UPI00381E4F75
MNPTGTHPPTDGAEASPVDRHTASTITDDALEDLYNQRDRLLFLALLLVIARTTPKETTA